MPVIFPYSKPDVTVGHAVHACISPPELYVPTPHCAHVILIPLPDTYAPASARNAVDSVAVDDHADALLAYRRNCPDEQ